MEHRGFAANISAFLPRRRTAQIRRELTVWRAPSHGRAEIFALPIFCAFLRLFLAYLSAYVWLKPVLFCITAPRQNSNHKRSDEVGIH